MLFLQLFITFFIIGVFGFGGGYAMISLIQTQVVVQHHWLSMAEFTNIVAISQMTPGPIGINTATYCGYTAVQHAGYGSFLAVVGSAVATLSLMLPSLILMILIARVLLRYLHHPIVTGALRGLRPAVVGLLAAAVLLLLNAENFATIDGDPWQFGVSVGLFVATFIGTALLKINPIKMIALAAFAGIFLL